ncbi:MAG: FAD:protein FMN transferase [Candidatus Pacebacteria bacterium]|nr:FAD:protein FMN transferase [Candidatus Paceibacterota bacterium]
MKFSITFQATGTTWLVEGEVSDVPVSDLSNSVDASSSTGSVYINDLGASIKQRIEDFESIYSRFRSDSLVAQIARAPKGKKSTYIFPEDARNLFTLYRNMSDTTDGLVTPLVGRVLSDAGYDSTYSLNPKLAIPSAPKWDEVMEYDHPVLTVYEPVMLDFGAIGKGYAIDIVGQLLKEKGFESYTVNAGGDISHYDSERKSYTEKQTGINKTSNIIDLEEIPLRIGLEHPDNPKQIIGVAEILNKSICGSAGNRRVWRNYHHIINPNTAISPKHISAVWVVTNTAQNSTAIADALTTGLFFIEPEMLMKRLVDNSILSKDTIFDFTFEYLIVNADSTMRAATHFPAKMF